VIRGIRNLLLLLLPTAALAAGGPYLGRPVAAVIDEFRDAGVPFAYSTALVGPELVVANEPDPGDPVTLVRQVLRPYGLTVRTEAGVHLIVRFDREGLEPGSVLLIITAADGSAMPSPAAVSVEPDIPLRSRLKPGILEFPTVAPGRYDFHIDIAGFESTRRVVDVWPGETKVISVDLRQARPTISVSASRYEILRDVGTSRFTLDRRTIRNMPDVGEDPIRVVQRLPGAAASGTSAKTHLRGGGAGEVGIILDGVRLFDPFHVRDYQSVFSTVDSRAIEGVEVYTGGFPVQFGNRMSGMVLMESMEALERRHTEIGLSIFNTSLLTAGKESGRRWVLSARRGNLDLIIDPEYGSPSYYDVFAEYSWDISPSTTLSFDALYADDRVEVILESDPEELEQVVSNTRNAQFWARLDSRWSDEFSSRTILSGVAFDNSRIGSLNDEAKIVATVLDDRQVTQLGFQQDFSYTQSDRHHVGWGLQVKYAEADYDYENSAEYFGLQALYPDQPDTSSLALSASPEGSAYAMYFLHRWKLNSASVLEWGLRWDDQTYTDLASDAQLSPRISYLHALGPSTDIRVSWGRYHQPQEINELQVEDGIDRFWRAQRADHLIVGLRHLFRRKYALRVEAFRKDVRHVMPRFENLFDPLGLIPEIQPDRVRLDPERAGSRGFEVSVDRSDGPWTWWALYVWSEATDRIDGRDERRSWDQRHAFQGGLSWGNEKWDVSVAASVHTGWPLTELMLTEDGVDDNGDPIFVAVPGPRNEGRHPTFASLDFRISRRWRLSRGSLLAFFEVVNATNRRNECCLDYDLEEDEATGELVFERGVDYWLPLLPAVGVLWEF